MKARYIEIDGKKVRIEFNWNTTIEFLDRCEISLDDFIELATGNKITPKHIRQLAWCGAIEGERVDGRELVLTEVEFGSKLFPEHITQIMGIFAEQFTGITGVVDEKKKKGSNPTVFERFFR
jgi:hypothetical protein